MDKTAFITRLLDTEQITASSRARGASARALFLDRRKGYVTLVNDLTGVGALVLDVTHAKS